MLCAIYYNSYDEGAAFEDIDATFCDNQTIDFQIIF